jgi:cytochrome c-type biogenesis protein CcmE
MKPKHQRLVLICSTLVGLGLSLTLILLAFQDSLVFFYTPSDLLEKTIHPQQRIRVGGLVGVGSTHRNGENVRFQITDKQKSIMVSYQGLLPDLFREGQGVVAEGHLITPPHFQALAVLAKHDENYMPKEVADGLRGSCK